MIIGIDGNEANVKNRVGIGRYAYELLREFAAIKNQNFFIIYLKSEPLSDLPKEDVNWKYRVIKPGKLWTQWRLPLDLYFHTPRPDVFFTPSHYAPRYSPISTVIAVMDLSYIYFPDLFNTRDLHQLRNWTKYSIKNAKRIMTISQSTKNDIIKEYDTALDRVVVSYPGIKERQSLTPHIYGMNQLKTKFKLEDSFVLFVGTLQPRKNIVRLIEAFNQVLESMGGEVPKDLQLVIVGKKGWQYEDILNAPMKYGIEDRVIFLDSVEDDELTILYKYALCFVLPSLYEGFGLPVLEAMQAGCPVITSNVSSLPEAGGDACLYINPEDVSDIADKIKKVVTSDKLRKDLREKGLKQAMKFSWKKTAKETLNILEEVGGRP